MLDRPEDCFSNTKPWRTRYWIFISRVVIGFLLWMPMGVCRADDLAAVQEIIQTHCWKCHDAETQEGGLSLADLSTDFSDSAIRQQWISIFDRVDRHEMPPKGDELPVAAREALLKTLEPALHEADLSDVRARGRGPMRRLNRDEFEQNLRDVLKLPDLNIRDMLPEDRTSHHFNKTSAMLDVSRVQLAAFLDASEAALHQALASGISPPPSASYRALATQMFQEAETFGNKEAMFYAREGKMLPLNGGQLAELRQTGQHDPAVEMALFRSAHWPYYGYPHGFLATLPGRYKVRFSARSVLQQAGYELQPGTHPVPMTFRARKPSGPDVSGDVRATGGLLDILPEPAVYDTTILLKPNETFEYSLLGLPVPLARNVNNGPPEYRYPPFPEGGQPGVAFQWIEVDGPLAPESWPPQSHKVLFDELPIQAAEGSPYPIDVVSVNPVEDSRRLLIRFIATASRKPMSDDESQPFQRLVESRLKGGDSFTTAMLAGYRAFLCSEHFLFLQEPRDGDSFDLASRLSHFMTNSKPDEILIARAHAGALKDPAVLREETDRLIGGDRFADFVQSFTDHWLNLRVVFRDEPDVRLYPEYRFDNYLVESMERETRAYFTAMVRENLPATSVVDSEFVFANDRLSAHYGLAPLSGSALRRVELPEDSPYGGLLTQGAVLKVTANGTTTSPVVRGAWIMDRLIGNPPPPPPASVPAVEPDIRGASTIRELLALHTKSESCAACHAKFDPVGLALESFDILGAYRERYRGLAGTGTGPVTGDGVTGIDRAGHDYSYLLTAEVDSAGQLESGEEFADIRDLRKLLLSDSRQLARNLLRQFIVYSTGTPVRFSDRREIERLLDECADGGYGIRDLIHALVQSRIFYGEKKHE